MTSPVHRLVIQRCRLTQAQRIQIYEIYSSLQHQYGNNSDNIMMHTILAMTEMHLAYHYSMQTCNSVMCFIHEKLIFCY